MQFLRRSSPDLDLTVETTKNAINTMRPELEGCLLQRFGNLALALEGALDRLYLPNIRGDEIHIPPRYRYSNKIPVIPQVTSPVTLATGFNEFGRRQYHNAIRQAKEHLAVPRRKAVKFVDNIHYLMRECEPFVVDMDDAVALTVGLGTRPDRNIFTDWPDKIVGRSAIFLDIKTADPGDVTHEIVHFLQNEQQPFTYLKPGETQDSHTARDELEAYHAGAIVEKADNNRITNYLIDYARSVVNVGLSDPFYPNNLMKLPHINKALERRC